MSGSRRRSAGAIRAISGATPVERVLQHERIARIADRLLDHLDEGQVRRGALGLHAVAGQHPHPARLGLARRPRRPGGTCRRRPRPPPAPGDRDRPVPRSTARRRLARSASRSTSGVSGGASVVDRPIAASAPGHLVEPPPLRESLEPEQPRVHESPRPGGLHGIADSSGCEYLASGGLGHDAGRGVQGLSVELPGPLVDIPDVDPDAHPDPALRVGSVVLLERPLDADRAADGVERGPEGEQEPVPEELPLQPAVAAELVPQDPSVGAEDLVGDHVPALHPERRRALDVRHHDRERLDRAVDVGHGLAPRGRGCGQPMTCRAVAEVPVHGIGSSEGAQLDRLVAPSSSSISAT